MAGEADGHFLKIDIRKTNNAGLNCNLSHYCRRWVSRVPLDSILTQMNPRQRILT